MFKTITASLLLLLACVARGDQENVLLWFFDDPEIEEVNGGGTVRAGTLVGRGGEAEGKTVNALRISATDSEGNKIYLNLADTATDIPRTSWDSWYSLPDQMGDYCAGPGFADVSGLNMSDTGMLFMMELGNYSVNDGVVNWIVLAGSQGSRLEDLLRDKNIVAEERSFQEGFNWEATGYAVPEPTSGLLVLIGGALLALRRKRKDAAA